MRLIRAKNYDDMSLKAANIIAAQVLIDPYQNILESELSHCPLGEAVPPFG